ncbi:16S rRNA (uracil(1498)-N(3))-methyltransferase [Abyssisolibacter fermentans]|uniref:16S rRNA (uracil(1498)-N(3))-methyltransferase n=1 Tax=Abyssisolibacter fermentans TaxID=1766203 RepID=UPI0008365CB8|nr:16S rRNA (uracil(1498)-N(3))-methyltransferase [Abyssisolibacter fermentans]
MNLIILFKEDFIEKDIVRIEGRRFEHVLSVHKAEVGQTLKVGLLNGKIGTGYITNMENKMLQMKVNLTDEPPKPLQSQLILAMPRPKVFARILQTATALGIKKIFVIKTWRVQKSYWNSPVLSEESLSKNMILGLEQTKDTILPEVRVVKLFKPFVEDQISSIIEGTIALVAHPIADAMCPYDIKKPTTIAIGPEGGFIEYEIDMLKKHGFTVVGFGNRILKVETAVPYIYGKLY